jgi:hypothetical protein
MKPNKYILKNKKKKKISSRKSLLKEDLMERRERTSMGGAILTARALSRNFHVMGT